MLNSHNLRQARKHGVFLDTWAEEDKKQHRQFLKYRMALSLLFMLLILFVVIIFSTLPGCGTERSI